MTFLCDKSKGLEQNYARSGVMINARRRVEDAMTLLIKVYRRTNILALV